ncbi:MAG: membrane protein insertion efficiency factor YidD [Zetaproteobacteria bacterium CG_4_9_14_3_um_filter_49_83]|nr:MAG: membrane protein insertion efficiency factor YidD [Zetaproteobacteria bacterium CG1_02_49_23]PIQ29913.1 MAG: membrane protein insertion efficiency factor YidD [Zetaproteobacteria bacterium CG17_big_fil_post_rev_8_21_14_2_50_50_13]PIV31046.1 MAG: membrane protein insertion efficiency factor YidD [Zetaproteobacteria bacterium CG02_land_8_20_14_3_00_50_9]PIY55232.1 MAG: membrane protein insertion efficiency factor YidD [Zetaproteobacteria bacterium CG_4_10_14_0_8_um_filter_49_80]PJA36243.1
MKKMILFPIHVYRYAISPFFPSRCIYTPSCSQYMIEAIQTFGIGRGLLLGVRRFFRCRPGVVGGYDPVPEISEFTK